MFKITENVSILLIFREKVLDLKPKSVCAVGMTIYVCSLDIYKYK